MKDAKSAANMNRMVELIRSGNGNTLPPIFVRKYKSGYQVLDGHHRFHAFQKAGAKTIPAKIIPDSEIQVFDKAPKTEEISETLKKVNGKWALVSRQDPKKVLQYYHGAGHPSKEWVSKVERKVHSFSESEFRAKHKQYIRFLDGDMLISDHLKDRLKLPDRKRENIVVQNMIVDAARRHKDDIMNLKDESVILGSLSGDTQVVLLSTDRPDGTKLYTLKTTHPSLRRGHNQRLINVNEAIEDMKHRVYLDMDGVLADFFGEWSKISGVNHYKDIKNIDKALDDIRKHPTFWTDLPVLPHAKELIKTVIDNYGEYYICSKPLEGDPRSESGKRAWIRMHLSDHPPAGVILTHVKEQHAMNGEIPSILIDDYGVNVTKWQEAGGIGIKYEPERFAKVKKMLEKLSK
jgi:5'(3')-deoxyribonucleotidase